MGETLTRDRVGTGADSFVLSAEDAATFAVIDAQYHNDAFSLVSAAIEGPHPQFPPSAAFDREGLLRDAEQTITSRTQKLLGQVAAREAIRTNGDVYESTVESTMSLADALQRAHEGDAWARELVRQNVRTDFLERAYKSGHISRVELDSNDQHQLLQYGQTMDEVHMNSLLHLRDSHLAVRAAIEAKNGQRIQYYFENGLLKENAVVIHSLVPDDIDRKHAKRLGYFTETMSCSIQMITEEEGRVVVYSAFVAGADEDGVRFDREATIHAAAKRGTSYQGMNANEILAHPELVRKDALPQGILTLVADYDASTGRFFGRQQTGYNDYQAQFERCRQRDRQAEALVTEVVNQLITEAALLKNPSDATYRLHVLNDALLKKEVITNSDIDSNVLGGGVAHYVEQARRAFANGDQIGMRRHQEVVQQLGQSSSCPTGVGGTDESSSKTLFEAYCPRLPKPGEYANCPGSCRRRVRVAGTQEAIACSTPNCSLEDKKQRRHRQKTEEAKKRQQKQQVAKKQQLHKQESHTTHAKGLTKRRTHEKIHT